MKVGTIKRAKGLELKQVLLARVDGSLLSPAAADLDEGALERREIERRELYVGMTRARDGLWVGLRTRCDRHDVRPGPGSPTDSLLGA